MEGEEVEIRNEKFEIGVEAGVTLCAARRSLALPGMVPFICVESGGRDSVEPSFCVRGVDAVSSL